MNSKPARPGSRSAAWGLAMLGGLVSCVNDGNFKDREYSFFDLSGILTKTYPNAEEQVPIRNIREYQRYDTVTKSIGPRKIKDNGGEYQILVTTSRANPDSLTAFSCEKKEPGKLACDLGPAGKIEFRYAHSGGEFRIPYWYYEMFTQTSRQAEGGILDLQPRIDSLRSQRGFDSLYHFRGEILYRAL